MGFLNQDTDGIRTAFYEGDPGDGSNKWHSWIRSAVLGERADAAVTNPATSATLMSNIRGLLTHLASIITQVTSTATNTGTLAGAVQVEDAAMTDATGRLIVGIKRMDTPAASGADLDVINVLGDSAGRVRVLATRDVSAGYPSRIATSALAASLVVKASAGRLHSLIGYSTTDQFVQVHNSASLPADTAVPILVQPIAANTAFNIPIPALDCATGIVVCNSTTGPTKTIGVADMFVTAIYD